MEASKKKGEVMVYDISRSLNIIEKNHSPQKTPCQTTVLKII
jgi:hypothetical protein